MKQKTKNILKIWLLSGALLCLGLIVIPHPAHAANSLLSGQICEPDNSSGGSGYNLARCVNNIYTFGVAIGGFVAVLMFVIAGYYYAQGGNENISTAKSYINSTIVGLILLFGTYALLNTIDPNLTRVPKIQVPTDPCASGALVGNITAGSGTNCANIGNGISDIEKAFREAGLDGSGIDANGNANGSVKGTTQTAPNLVLGGTAVKNCVNCLDLNNSIFKTFLKVAAAGQPQTGHYAEANLMTNIYAAYKADNALYITEAWPPTVPHKSACHYDGRCVDISINPSLRSSNYPNTTQDINEVKKLCLALVKNGLKVVNEYYNIAASNFAGSGCPAPTQFTTTKGPHLHVTSSANAADAQADPIDVTQ